MLGSKIIAGSLSINLKIVSFKLLSSSKCYKKNIVNNRALKKTSQDYDACCVKNVFCVFRINVMVSTEKNPAYG